MISETIASYETDERYWNQIGPFGGWIAAALLRPVLEHSERHGSPLSITINFAAAIRAGRYDVRVELLRRNRSTSFWFVRFLQEQDGETVHCADATVVMAVRRPMMSFAIAKPPEAREPEAIAPANMESVRAAWMRQYDLRFVSGQPFTERPADEDVHTVAWVREREEPTLTFASLLAMCDTSFPQIFHRVTRFVPISTVSMTVYFHASDEDLAAVGSDFILYDATMRVAYDGFFDESSTLYSRDGKLLATMEQIVWYKIT